MPKVVRRNQIPFFNNLISANGAVNDLRNTVQHLPEQIHGLATDPNWSVWGVLSWCVPPAADAGNNGINRGASGRTHLFQPPEQLREADLQDVGDLAGGVCRDVTPDAFGRFRAWKAIPVST